MLRLVALFMLGISIGHAQPAAAWIPPQADLAITKVDTPDPVMPGSNLTYFIRLMDFGPDAATGVALSDAIPANTTFVSLSQTSGPAFTCTTPAVGGTGAVACSALSLAAGASASFTLVVKVGPNTPLGSRITNTAEVHAATLDFNLGNNSATAKTDVRPNEADLAVWKSGSPTPVIAGNDLTYSISVVNNGPDSASGVTLTDPIPANTTFVSFTQNSGPAFTLTTPSAGGTGTVTATIGTLASGATATFTLVVNVDASTQWGSTVTNTVSVCSNTNDPTTGNNSATTTTKVKTSADLAVSKSDSPDPVTAGNDLTYVLQLTSAGPSDAQNVALTDAIPANTTFVSFTQTSGPAFTLTTPPSGGTGTVSATIGTFIAGASASFTLVVNVDANTADGTIITNIANVCSDTNDPAAGNNTAPTTTTVSSPSPSADLAVSKSDSPDPVDAGGELSYAITVVNNGPADAQSVALTDAIPTNTTFVSFTQDTGPAFTLTTPPSGGTGTVSATIATLASGVTATFTLVVTVDATTADGTVITNTANISSNTSDPAAANNTAPTTTTVSSPSTDLAVSKIDDPDPVGPGQDLTYSITVVNNGPAPAQNVTLSDAIPANTIFVSFTQNSGPAFTLVTPPVDGTGTVTASISTLAPGATATFTLVVNVDPGAQEGSVITNTASLSSSTNDSSTSNNSATTTTTVGPVVPPGG